MGLFSWRGGGGSATAPHSAELELQSIYGRNANLVDFPVNPGDIDAIEEGLDILEARHLEAHNVKIPSENDFFSRNLYSLERTEAFQMADAPFQACRYALSDLRHTLGIGRNDTKVPDNLVALLDAAMTEGRKARAAE